MLRHLSFFLPFFLTYLSTENIPAPQGVRNGVVSVRLSVCPICRPLQQRVAAGLLLGALLAGDIDRLLRVTAFSIDLCLSD